VARGYRRLSAADVDEIWVRLRLGMGPSPLLGSWGCRPARFGRICCGVAGSVPTRRRRSPGRLSFVEREEISRGLAAGRSLRAIAVGLGRSA
jgi:hypothetical protein